MGRFLVATTVCVLTIGCTAGDKGSGPAESPAPVAVTVTVTVTKNPHNPFSRILDVSAPEGTILQVVHTMGSTPPQGPGEILVLGLAAGMTHSLEIVADGLLAKTVEVTTDPLPAGWPTCEVEGELVEQEVVCTNGKSAEGKVYHCVDKAGRPVWSLRHPDGVSIVTVRSLPDGGFAAVGASSSLVAFFNARGERTAEYVHTWFSGKTRFDHHTIDMHEVIAIAEGKWAGAVAFLTATIDTIDGEELLAPGIIVMDPQTGAVLWDWLAHGQLGDGTPIDPAIDFTRDGSFGQQEDTEGDVLHANALLHRLYPDGHEELWLSLRHQDWIISINPETDGVNWRLGVDGDFEGPDVAWFHQQHAPEVRVQDGETRLLIFDNGVYHPGKTGESRVVELAIDEEAMTVEHVAEVGGFYAFGAGDADLLHDGERLQFVVGWDEPTKIVEVSWPDGEELWRMTCDGGVLYRVNSFPNIYDRAWWYDVER
jgi:hypothetical protein